MYIISNRDKKQRAKTASRHKIKNVLELTKMVQSGKLKVPKSLLHYIDDHGTLLEQLFTILTQEDIKGMAPDTLKVCYVCLVRSCADSALPIECLLNELLWPPCTE